ncbi:MAG: phage minor capsid protein [Christensenellaceae bacterium]
MGGERRYTVRESFGARPSHAEWQGQIVDRSGRDRRFLTLDDIGYGAGDGFKGWNCRHDWAPFIPGVSVPTYTQEELRNIDPPPIEYNGKTYTYYEATQRQRRIETAMRKTKREIIAADGAGLKDDLAAKSVLLRRQKEEYINFSSAAGLRAKTERTGVLNYGRSISQKAVWAEKRFTKQQERVKIDFRNTSPVLRIPQVPASDITKKIQAGEYSIKLSLQQYLKHVPGTPQYKAYEQARAAKSWGPQSELFLSTTEAEALIKAKAGTGIVRVSGTGKVQPIEDITCDKIIGRYFESGAWHDTNKASIRYGKKSSHLVPIKGANYD